MCVGVCGRIGTVYRRWSWVVQLGATLTDAAILTNKAVDDHLPSRVSVSVEVVSYAMSMAVKTGAALTDATLLTGTAVATAPSATMYVDVRGGRVVCRLWSRVVQ